MIDIPDLDPGDAPHVELPKWAQVSDKRRAHIARVTALLLNWAAAMRLDPATTGAWVDAGRLHDALRDAPIEELRKITGDTTSPDGFLHGPAVAIKIQPKNGGDIIRVRFQTRERDGTVCQMDPATAGNRRTRGSHLPGRRLAGSGWKLVQPPTQRGTRPRIRVGRPSTNRRRRAERCRL